MKQFFKLLLLLSILFTFTACFHLKEKRLKKELQQLQDDYTKINNRLDSLDKVLNEMDTRDSVFYNSISKDSATKL
jgi:hypothetical protein